MKQITLLFILCFTVSIGFGQFGKGSPEIIKSWKNRTLIVIKYPNSDIYNEAVKTVVNERWYNKNVEYLDYANIKEIKKRKDIVVLNIKNWMDFVNLPVICLTTKMNGHFEYNFTYNNYGSAYMNIQSAHSINWKEWYGRFKNDKSKKVKNSSISWGLEKIRQSSLERTKLVVEILFNTIDKFNDGEYEYKNAKKDNIKYNHENFKSIINTKTLLIPKNDLPRTKKNKKLLKLDHIQSIYNGKVKIVTEDELKESIKNKDNTVVYLHVKEEVTQPAFSIIDISTRKIIFSGIERTKPGDASPVKIFERMLLSISNSIH